MPSDDSQEVSYVAPTSAPEPEVTATSDDADTGTQAGGDEQAQDDQDQDDQKEPRTFTQDELDKIVQKERAKAERAIRRDLERQQQEARRPANGPAPDRNEFPAGDAGDVAFWNASVDFASDHKLMQREQQTQQTQVKTQYQEREEAAYDKYPDFKESVYKDPHQGGPAVTHLMADVIAKSELGPEMAYHLAKNVTESHRIYALDPIDQVRELTKLEAKLAASPKHKRVSSAPEPIRPIAGSAPVNLRYGVEDPRSDKSMTHEQWIAERNKTANR